ncbi:YdeI/OmpD-associated family protein [Devosia chinhatensis]|uniref:DUF1905 domain-containing protein n=1 Tax=Devosia chinhatensis TaxID=429727 RepID=A0A0F5FJX6_9HYPH|nr:YdeI/OmpD-associated family protein [Devosia chinhatensis]KKB08885.1 hypothetical protein VE26_02200 [Devosia chinhatensis]
MSFYAFDFQGVVDTLDYEKYLHSVIYLPVAIANQLPLAAHPRLRVEGEINDYPFSGAFIPSSQGHHLILGSARLKAMGLKVGMPVELRFNIADQDCVDVPEELLGTLSGDKAAQQAWDALTPGKRRGLAHFVGSAKTGATRDKRAMEIALGLTGKPGGKLSMQAHRTTRL